MQRRQFLKNSVLLSAAGLVGPALANETVKTSLAPIAPVMRRRFVLSQTYKLVPPQGSSGVVKLWIPLPVDTAFQQMTGMAFTGNYQQAYVTTNNAYGAKTLFATWPKSEGDLLLQLDLEIETADWEPLKHDALKNWQAPEQIVYPLAVKPYLLPTTHTPVDGLVRETAQKITGGETDPLKKARLIYEWVSSHMERDNDVIGCGTGDVATILQSGKLSGKCTDISSVFVALARASGIPARELFGIRLGRANKLERYSASAFGKADSAGVADVSGGQHCRAEFYLAGYGWLPCDPADVTKMRLAEKKAHQDPDVQAVNAYLFGNWEMNWVGFNYGRDFELYPATEQGAVNNFGYPYAEVDGDPLNFYDPKVFTYHYVSTEQR
ncbi:transglutaminase-like domain-containing protein [Leclercia adecarboxylata]|uniref:transglutaminase-like domain-containing protein n=1 Tax=Leclercia adecarboxylata TaxID=83655 RepID=UPI0021F1FD01|nr:transglutaminase family protein [Leclercia adecarboxylata]UYM55354.1 transglutaminase family protein [Leclercia adecarboxylata]